MIILTTTSSFGDYIIADNIELIKNPYGRRLNEKEVKMLLEKHKPDAIVAGLEPLTKSVLSGKPYLKVISRCGVGIDNVDLKAAESCGIKIFNTPDAPVASVAEITVALILTLIKKINILDAGIRKGNWKGPKGNMLSGKTVGIIGCGRIGNYVAGLLKAFGCNIIGFDKNSVHNENIKQVGFEKLIRQSDIVSLHIPYNESTRNIINAEELSKMKETALIINTARGGLINESALYRAVKNNIIGGAALDCFENEPYSGSLTELENIVLTPHIASSAVESREKMEKEALENILKYL